MAVTLAVFFGIGSLKSRVLTISWWRGGLETLVTGAAAAAIAYGIGVLLRNVAA
jgi:vacuolar iron transporter family protein